MYDFKDFKMIKESERSLDSFMDNIIEMVSMNKELNESLNEEASLGQKLGAALTLKGRKLKKPMKEYQKDLVDQALSDLDFEKRLQKGDVDADAKKRLDAAHKTKKEQLKAKQQADLEKIDDIAGNNKGLQAIAKTGKIEARMKATKIAMQHADDDEAKQLKLKMQDLEKDKRETLADIKDYASTKDDDAAKQEKEKQEKEKEQQEKDRLQNAQHEGDPKKGDSNGSGSGSGNGSGSGSGKGKGSDSGSGKGSGNGSGSGSGKGKGSDSGSGNGSGSGSGKGKGSDSGSGNGSGSGKN